MKDGTGKRSEKYSSPFWKYKWATGLEGRQPPHESAILCGSQLFLRESLPKSCPP